MKRSALLILAMTLTGCMSTSFSYRDQADGRKEEVSRTFLISGLVADNEPLRAYDFCPEGIARIQTIHTFGDVMLTILTLTIYSPNTVRVTCSGGAAGDDRYSEDNEKAMDGTPLAQTDVPHPVTFGGLR